MKVLSKVKEWARRYLPAEIIATITSIAGAYVAYALTGSMITTAYVGALTENIGFYGYFFVKEARLQYKIATDKSRHKRLTTASTKTLRNLFVEFGVAELFDSLVIRPFCLYWAQKLIPTFPVAIFVGKVSADVIFYCFAIAGYEVKKRLK